MAIHAYNLDRTGSNCRQQVRKRRPPNPGVGRVDFQRLALRSDPLRCAEQRHVAEPGRRHDQRKRRPRPLFWPPPEASKGLGWEQNVAIAVAEANFSALYGYDIRGEVFGSKGMVQAGRATENAARRFTAEGMSADTPRLNVELFRQAYTDELADSSFTPRAAPASYASST